MTIKTLLAGAAFCLVPAMFAGMLPNTAAAQGLSSADLLKPLANDWPTYSGDYSGKRYSKLTQVNQSNVKTLTLAWTSRMTAGAGGAGGGRRGFGGGAPPLGGGGRPAGATG